MTQLEVTSGELLYRLNQLNKLDLLPDQIASNNLRSFLDISGKDQSRKRDIFLGKILNLRPIIERTHQGQIKHVKSLENYIENYQRAIMAETKKESETLKMLLNNNSRTFDTNALQSALDYFSILKKDIEGATEHLRRERSEKDALKKQAKVYRDIMLFSCHLKLETNKKIEITALSTDSAQFIRCMRAVHDNIGQTFGMQLKPRQKMTPKDIRILNVFKLKNDFLSRSLQVSMINCS